MLTLLRMLLNNTEHLTSKVVQKTSFFGDFNDQPIPSTYSDITNDYDDNGTQIYASLMDNKGVEYEVAKNDENNNDDSIASDIEPPQTIVWKLNEWTEWEMKPKKGKLKKWNHTMK